MIVSMDGISAGDFRAARSAFTSPPPDIDRSGLAKEVERCEYCGDTGDAHRTDGEWLGECTCGRAMPQSS